MLTKVSGLDRGDREQEEKRTYARTHARTHIHTHTRAPCARAQPRNARGTATLAETDATHAISQSRPSSPLCDK